MPTPQNAHGSLHMQRVQPTTTLRTDGFPNMTEVSELEHLRMLADLRTVERRIRRHCSCSVPDEHRLTIHERTRTLVLACGTCGELCKAAATEDAHDMAVRQASSSTLYGDVNRVFAAVGSRPSVSERTYFNTAGRREYKAAIDTVYLDAVLQVREDAKQRIDSAAPDVRATAYLKCFAARR